MTYEQRLHSVLVIEAYATLAEAIHCYFMVVDDGEQTEDERMEGLRFIRSRIEMHVKNGEILLDVEGLFS